MIQTPLNVFNYRNIKAFLNDYMSSSKRGTQARMARAIGCQATYLIKMLGGSASLTEDQAFRAGHFLKLSPQEFDYFLDLARLDRADDVETKKYLMARLEHLAGFSSKLKSRVAGKSIDQTPETQAVYFSNWKYSTLHLATSCRAYQSIASLAKKFKLEPDEVSKILHFLEGHGLVHQTKPGVFVYSGRSIHLAKESPFQPIFQKVRREFILRTFSEGTTSDNLHFSAAFATSTKHLKDLRNKFLKLIEETNSEIEKHDAEELALLVIDFTQI